MTPLLKKISWLTFFSIAMGFMEAAVVVYLRKIYYPNGFMFPLVPIGADIGLVEVIREAATIIMLLSIGILTGKKASQKFAIFIYCFAIWDIFYYVFLKLLLNWPESFLTPDILFLIPFPWIGPVISPVIVSLTMIALSLFIIYYDEKNAVTRIRMNEWFLFISGSVVIIFSFMWDYIRYELFTGIAQIQTTQTKNEFEKPQISNVFPHDFNWWIFLIGELLIIYGIKKLMKRLVSGSQRSL